jgi:hypothetical protein
MTIDLDKLNYSEWLNFVFARPVAEFNMSGGFYNSEPWYLDDEWKWQATNRLLVERLLQLFAECDQLLLKFSEAEIDQGLWFISSAHGFMWVIVDRDIEIARREKLVDAMYLFSLNLLCKLHFSPGAAMWWDSLFAYAARGDQEIASDLPILAGITHVISKLKVYGDEAADQAEAGLQQLKKIYGKADKETQLVIAKELSVDIFR